MYLGMQMIIKCYKSIYKMLNIMVFVICMSVFFSVSSPCYSFFFLFFVCIFFHHIGFLDTFDAHFTGHPPNPLYVVKGETANFIWIYHVKFDKYSTFDYYSPVWFYRDANNNEYEIGKDYRHDEWKFHISTSTCPARLLSPKVRVSREDQATLVINSTTLPDSGTYGCRLNLRYYSPKTSTVDLIITGTNLYEVPKIRTRNIY